jgi:hypothetical protein
MAKKTKAAQPAPGPAGTPRMLEHYVNTVRPALGQMLARTNPHAIPKLEKIVVNMGVGVAVTEAVLVRDTVGLADPDKEAVGLSDAAAVGLAAAEGEAGGETAAVTEAALVRDTLEAALPTPRPTVPATPKAKGLPVDAQPKKKKVAKAPVDAQPVKKKKVAKAAPKTKAKKSAAKKKKPAVTKKVAKPAAKKKKK